MHCAECLKKDKKITKLTQKIKELKSKFYELSSHPKMIAGLKGESLIVRIAKGVKSKQNASYDVVLQDGSKVEVKFANLHTPNPVSPTSRWLWHRVYGNKKMKDYRYLVLIGEKDTRYQSIEEDNSHFVFFLLSSTQIDEVTTNDPRGSIYLTTNPRTIRNRRGRILWRCRKKAHEMEEFFKNVVITTMGSSKK